MPLVHLHPRAVRSEGKAYGPSGQLESMGAVAPSLPTQPVHVSIAVYGHKKWDDSDVGKFSRNNKVVWKRGMQIFCKFPWIYVLQRITREIASRTYEQTNSNFWRKKLHVWMNEHPSGTNVGSAYAPPLGACSRLCNAVSCASTAHTYHVPRVVRRCSQAIMCSSMEMDARTFCEPGRACTPVTC